MIIAKARIRKFHGGTILSVLKLPTAEKSGRVKVGFPAGKVDGGIVARAFFNEFGTRGGGWGGPIPERPFFRNALRNNEAKYRANLAIIARRLLAGETSMSAGLSKLGIMAQGDIQNEITALSSPPNSPTTIGLKGSSNPLIDTDAMRASVTWEVKE